MHAPAHLHRMERKHLTIGVVLGLAVAIAGVCDDPSSHLPAWIARAGASVLVLWGIHTAQFSIPLRAWTLCAPAWILLTFGLASTAHLGLALQDWVTWSISLALLVGTIVRPALTLIWLTAMCIAVTPHVLWALLQRSVTARAGGGFVNPNDLAAVAAPLAVWVASLTLRMSRTLSRRQQLGSMLLITTLGAALFASGSRTGFLTVSLAGLLLCVAENARRPLPKWLPMGLVVVILLAILWLAPRWLGHQDPYAYSRMQLWRASTAVALEHPWGVGLGGFADALRVHGVPIDALVRYPKTALDAHNEWIQVWVELGWLGAGVALGTLATLVGFILQQPTKPERWHAWAIFCAFFLPSLLMSNLHIPWVALTLACWIGTLIPTRAPETRDTMHARVALTILLVGALAFALPGVVGQHYKERAIRLRQQGNIEQAITAATRSVRWTPWSTSASLLELSLRHAVGRPIEETMRDLQQVMQRHPHAWEPAERLARLAEATHNSSDGLTTAIALTEAARQRHPLHVPLYLRLARLWHKAADPQRALYVLEQALQIEPHFVDAHALRSIILTELGNTDEAASARQQALQNHDVDLQSTYADRVLSLSPNLRKMLERENTTHP